MAQSDDIFRRASRRALKQGDIAFGEFHQLRARSADRAGPGPKDLVAPNLPALGSATDYELTVTRPNGGTETRVLRIWQGYVIVLHQNCELDFGNREDSRLIIAPLVSEPNWPEGPWGALRKNLVPGYFYVPSLTAGEAEEFGLKDAWPESVVVLANTSLSSVGLIQPRRVLSLSTNQLGPFQDSISRFFAVRGYAGMPELKNVIGKSIVSVDETDQTVSGPSRLVKVIFGGNEEEPDDEDDEISMTYWGVRV